MGVVASDGACGATDAAIETAMREIARGAGTRELTVGVALSTTAALRAAADRKLFELVGLAREAGATWAEIGGALGVSAQASHQRYGRVTRPTR